MALTAVPDRNDRLAIYADRAFATEEMLRAFKATHRASLKLCDPREVAAAAHALVDHKGDLSAAICSRDTGFETLCGWHPLVAYRDALEELADPAKLVRRLEREMDDADAASERADLHADAEALRASVQRDPATRAFIEADVKAARAQAKAHHDRACELEHALQAAKRALRAPARFSLLDCARAA